MRAKAPKTPSALWMPATVLTLGAASLLMIVLTDWVRERLVATDVVRLEALVEIQLNVATAHLWLEEYVTGDDVDTSRIWSGLERADDLVSRLLVGGSINGSRPFARPITDSAMRIRVEEIRDHVTAFADQSRERFDGFQSGDDVGVGSGSDVLYDAVFGSLLAAVEGLETEVRADLSRSNELSRVLFWSILASWLAIVGLAVTGLWTRERRRLKAVEDLAATEAQLLQMQKMDAVGRLAGGITHDINNYLAAIATNCELVQMRAEPGGPVAAKMETVLGVVSKASSLIDRLLAFSRQQPVEAQVVNLNRLIDDPEKMIVRSIGEDTRLESRLEPDLWNTEIDPAQLEQVVLNLLVNARQAMPSGGVVTIETANIELAESYGANDALVRAGEYVMLAVSDDGPGIPAENLDRIFEPFFTTKDRSSNNGLGLATIYGIVNQNGGHVRVQSELGQGATFKIYLPRVQAEESAQAEAWRAPVETAEGTECILLVEDNDDFRRSAEALLEGLGYRVIAAASGKEALDLYDRHGADIDLLLTDVVMPEMSGKELQEKIHAYSEELPVIFMSGNTENVILRSGLVEDKINLLRKPFSADRLLKKIREVLRTEPPAPS